MLYERHSAAAWKLARQLTRAPSDADDLVAEAFTKLLDGLRAGSPSTAFRAYLLTTVRNTFHDRIRRDRRVQLDDDMTRHDAGVPFVDPAVEGLEAHLVASAFASLPERWQLVLWHTEVEGEPSSRVAELLGATPNAAAALAYRAREGLRLAYLQAHLADTTGEGCRSTVRRLGVWLRKGLSRRDSLRMQRHLDDCADCRRRAEALSEVNRWWRIPAPARAPAGPGSVARRHPLAPSASSVRSRRERRGRSRSR